MILSPSQQSIAVTTSPHTHSAASAAFNIHGHTLQSLAALSRNTSVISNSSSSSSSSSVVAPVRPRPMRIFTSPQARNLGNASPVTPRAPSFVTGDHTGLGFDSTHLSNIAIPLTAGQATAADADGPKRPIVVTAKDFVFGHVLGEGSYSTVVLGKLSATGGLYAVKILDKRHILKERKQKYVHSERSILAKLGATGHKGIVRLHWTFHDEASLYFVLDLARNGELFSKINKLGSFSLPCTRYYAAQIIDVVCWMHSQGILHRDIKPENILLDDNMSIMITDFGTAKVLDHESQEQRSRSFVGTPHYASPELLLNDITCQASDIWAVGCIIFQLIAGYTPFKAATIFLIMENIKRNTYSFPEGFDESAKDLVEKILVPDARKRLGSGETGTNDLKSHPFFEPIQWSAIWEMPAPPLEVGMFKKTPPPPPPAEAEIDAMWDEMIASEDEMDAPEDVTDDDRGSVSVDDADSLAPGPEVEDDDAEVVSLTNPYKTRRSGGSAGGRRDASGEVQVDESGIVQVEESVIADSGDDDDEVDADQLEMLQTPKFSNRITLVAPESTTQTPRLGGPTTQRGSVSSGSGSSTEGSRHSRALMALGVPLSKGFEFLRGSKIVESPTTSEDMTAKVAESSRSSPTVPSVTLPSVTNLVTPVPPAPSVIPSLPPSSLAFTASSSPITPSIQALLLPSESVLLVSPVLSRTHRRLLPASQRPRILILTNQRRLLCVKEGPGGKSLRGKGRTKLKAEMLVGNSSSSTRRVEGKQSEPVALVLDVKADGDRTVVVRTAEKSFTYVTNERPIAARWLKELQDLLSAPPPSATGTTPAA